MKVIDYKETMKCLDEVEDCEDKIFAKSLLEWAINKRTFEAVPLSVIEDIKAEIRHKQWYLGVDNANQIIDLIDDAVKEVNNNV